MNRFSLVPLLLAVAFVPGCLHSKKNAKPKENPAIAAETDENFRIRFMDKRVAELTGQGVVAEAARAQAAEEFKARYGYTSAAKK